MAGKQLIEVRVGPNGEVEVEAHGMKGPGCKNKTAWLEEALGGKEHTKKKIEWYVENQTALRKGRRLGVNGGSLCG